MERFNRVNLLFGESFKKLQSVNILLLGVGGVGSFALDCLYRTGVQNITIIDFDSYEESNRNRQIGSDNNIGRIKVEVLKELYPDIEAINRRLTPQWVKEFDFSPFDIVIDAIDDIDVKVALAHKVSDKLISSMGATRQIDPTQIEFSTIWKTESDPFAKAIRTKLRKTGFKKSYRVVFSRAKRIGKDSGSFVGVTGSFGLALCSLTIDTLFKLEDL